jgi:5-(carboxyamino)imidazole ribonucleotide synthase
VALLVEQWVRIEREVAVLVARRPGGAPVVYPVVETVQVDGICHELHAPAPLPPALAAAAGGLGRGIAEALGVTGILAVELFLTEGRLLVNELAARPHNSGHFSIEGCGTSQFENHLRAVLDWPLGDPALAAPAVATVNVLGRSPADPHARLPQALAVPGVHVHLYDKPARPGRKLGHVTATGGDPAEVRARARRAAEILAGGESGEEGA